MKKLLRRFFPRRVGRVDGLHLVQFFRQMAVLTQAGIPMIRCLEVCGRQCSDEGLAIALSRLLSELRGGGRLSRAMRSVGAPFTSLHVNAAEAGEVSGNYEKVLQELSHWEERQHNLRRRISMALQYPILICLVSAIGMVLLVKCLVPLIHATTQQSGLPPSVPTRVLVALGEILDRPLPLAMGVALIGLIAYWLRRLLARPHLRWALDKFGIRLPILGGLIKKVITIRVCLAMSSLLRAGLPLVQTVELTGHSCGNRYVQESVFSEVARHIRKGEKFSQAIAGTRLFPRSFHGMVAVGEQTGDVDEILTRLARLYEMELDSDIDSCLAAMEPIIIAVVGVIVLGVLLCAFLPLFDLLRGFSGS